MAISYCSAAGKCFSYTTGTGIPAGMCLFEGKQMAIPEAEQLGIELGLRVEFRKTESFWMMLKHFQKFYGNDKVREYTDREELDFEDALARLDAMED